MADIRYHRVSPKFWSDPTVLGWNDDTRLLALYILTCEHRTTEGLFRLPKQYILADLEWSRERLTEPFAQLLSDGFIEYDDEARVMLIVKAMAYQSPSNPNGVKSALKALSELPPNRLYERFYDLAAQHCERLREQLAEPLRQRSGNPPAPAPAPAPEEHVATTDVVPGSPDPVDEQFEQLWGQYPRHAKNGKPGGGGDKKPAQRRWRNMSQRQRDAALVAVKHYAAWCESPEGEFPKHASTWLNAESWEQWQEPAQVDPGSDESIEALLGIRGYQ